MVAARAAAADGFLGVEELYLTPREDLASVSGDRVNDKRWKVGALAQATGVTVRTLHHFDAIGLLSPVERSAGGHRLYTADDVRRLYRILALRQLGIPLTEIAASLDGSGADFQVVAARQLESVDQQVA